MNINRFSHPAILLSLALLLVISCALPGSPTPFQPTATENTGTEEPVSTETTPPTTQESTDTGASCTVLQDLNLRFGPGTAYRPPIRALPANSTIAPLGFAPLGIPGGSWAYVQADADKGWVSAGSQYISCNVELASLPSVEFGTPPTPPLPQSTQTSDPDGSGFCIDADEGYECVGIFSEAALLQFKVLKDGLELGPDDGMGPVTFTVTREGETVYTLVENIPAYCIFSGNGPCNEWVFEDGVYKWTSGGAPVEPGQYTVNVDISLNGENTNWRVDFTVVLP